MANKQTPATLSDERVPATFGVPVGRILKKAIVAFLTVVATVLIADLPAEAQLDNCALNCAWKCRSAHTECGWWTRSCDPGGCTCGYGCKRREIFAGGFRCADCHRPDGWAAFDGGPALQR